MRTSRRQISLAAAAIAALVLAPAAMAAPVIPPTNSAATQYTEAFPTPGGDTKTDHSSRRHPNKVLGAGKTRKLEQHGADGRAVAAVTAATAPSTVEAEPAPEENGGDEDEAAAPASRGGDGGRGDGATAPQKRLETRDTESVQVIVVEKPDGSSGLGEVLGQATGLSSSSQSGPLLPLIVLATILCSIAYLFRQRRQVD